MSASGHLSRIAAGIAVASWFAACGGLLASVPDESKGTIAVTIDNQVDGRICGIQMTPQGGASKDNWLHSVWIFPGVQRTFDVKASTYALAIDGCGKYRAEQPLLRIDGPTYITVGRNHVDPPAGFTLVQLPVIGTVADYVKPAPPPQSYGGGGGAAAPPAAAETDEPKRDCWPDGHSCEYATDPCCNSCRWDVNTHLHQCE